MNSESIILFLVGLLIGFSIIYFLNKKNSGSDTFSKQTLDRTLMGFKDQEERLERTRQELQEQLERSRKEQTELLRVQNELLNKQLQESSKSIQQNFAISQKAISETQKETSEIVKNVTEKLTVLEKTNDQIVDFAKQMDSLEKILKNPKQRGILGEYFLETTLKNVMPPDGYQMQYKFKNGEIVDAVVFIKDKIVPIDSKFSLENYNRILESTDQIEKEQLEIEFKKDLKIRIEETSKYIRPNEGTMDFAFMFIPSEGIYYDLLVNKVGAVKINTRDLISYAFAEKNVIIVSPTSFLAYLQTVLQGLRALQIEESAKQIKENVAKLVGHLNAYEEHFSKVGNHLQTTVNFYNKAHKELKKVDKDVMKISDRNLEITAEEIENSQAEITD